MPTRFERAERNRDAILDAAAYFFEQRGYAGTYIQEFLDRAGATKGAMYHYWPTKLDVANELLSRGTQEWQELLNAVPEGIRGVDAIYGMWRALAVALHGSVRLRAFLRIRNEVDAAGLPPLDRLRDEVVVRLQQAIVDGDVSERINTARASAALIDAVYGVLVSPGSWNRDAELESRLDQVWSMLLPGLRAL